MELKTVGDLKKAIQDLPDDTPVCAMVDDLIADGGVSDGWSWILAENLSVQEVQALYRLDETESYCLESELSRLDRTAINVATEILDDELGRVPTDQEVRDYLDEKKIGDYLIINVGP